MAHSNRPLGRVQFPALRLSRVSRSSDYAAAAATNLPQLGEDALIANSVLTATYHLVMSTDYFALERRFPHCHPSPSTAHDSPAWCAHMDGAVIRMLVVNRLPFSVLQSQSFQLMMHTASSGAYRPDLATLKRKLATVLA